MRAKRDELPLAPVLVWIAGLSLLLALVGPVWFHQEPQSVGEAIGFAVVWFVGSAICPLVWLVAIFASGFPQFLRDAAEARRLRALAARRRWLVDEAAAHVGWRVLEGELGRLAGLGDEADGEGRTP